VSRPIALDVRVEGIPDTLKAEPRWVCWRYELDEDKQRWGKVPFQASNYPAKSNDASTWTTFQDALAAYRSGRFDGLGFMLGDGWSGIDLDRCVTGYDPRTGGLAASTPHIGDYLRALDTRGVYWEISPSGTGYKAFGRATRIGGEIKFSPDQLPITKSFSNARYFVVTGHNQCRNDRMVGLDDLIDAWFPPKLDQVVSPFGERPAYIPEGDTRGIVPDLHLYPKLSDDEVVARIVASPQATKFLRLVRGDISDYGDDRSRADQALCNILAYWCQNDVEQIDRLFRESGLMRPKWETRSYRLATLRLAVRS
jgi:primase-polymerase (primpol)-like protein